MITALRANPVASPELQVEPQGLESSFSERDFAKFQGSQAQVPGTPASTSSSIAATNASASEDPLVDLFRHQFQVPVDAFMQQMRDQRQSVGSQSS
jgi:hypothetical protein